MTCILLIGDTHIPDRAYRIPDELIKLIEEGKPWDIVVFTGDFTGYEVYDYVKNLGHRLYAVMGNMDNIPLQKKAVFQINDLRIGVHHGDGIYPRGDVKGLTRIASSLEVDILFNGHTHTPFIKTSFDRRILFVNPGSLTGVWGGGGGSMKPCMMVVKIGDEITINQYELVENMVKSAERRIGRRDSLWVL